MMPYTPAEVERLRRLRNGSASVRSGWTRFAARMEVLDASTLAGWTARQQELATRAREHGGHKIFSLGNFVRSAVAHAPQLAFYAAVEQRAAARHAALQVCELPFALPEWRIQAGQNGWRSDLWTAEFCAHLGLTYLQLRDTLSPAERARFVAQLWQRGLEPLLQDWIEPRARFHALDSMGDNWWSVCVSGAALGLFAIRDDRPGVDAHLAVIAEAYVEFFGYPGNVLQNKHRTFGAQGDYIESAGYLDYALHDAVTVFDLYRTTFDHDLAASLPVLARICDYCVALAQPLQDRTQRLNFGNMGAGADSVGSYNHQPASTWLWLAQRFGREDLFHLVRQTHPEPAGMVEFLRWPEDAVGRSYAGAPGDTVFANTGVAVLRDGYGPECTVFALRTGEIWNHNQPDVGTFILSAAGREFLIDGGALEYSNPRYWSYLRTAEAHNVICHGGHGPDPELDYHGTKFPGSVPVLLTAPGYRYLLADGCGPWVPVYRRFYRHVLWVDDFLLLVDDLHAYGAGAWRQLWHFRGEAAIEGPRVTLTNEGETLVVQRLFPTERTDRICTGFLPRMQGDDLKYEYALDELPYLATECPDRGPREKFINLLLLPRGAEKTVRTDSGPEHQRIDVADARGRWSFWCNHLADGRRMHQNSELVVDGLRTDAFLIGLHRDPDGRLDRFVLHNGSFLHLDGATLHSSLLKVDLCVDIGAVGRTFHAHATASTRAHYTAAGGDLATVALPAGSHVVRCG